MVALGVHFNLVSSDTVPKEKCSDTLYLSAIEAFYTTSSSFFFFI